MAIDIKFDLVGNPEPPTIILATRNGKKLGQLDVNANSIELADKLNDASEFSFTLNKYINGEITNLWDKVVDFKLIYCKEWDMWFETSVELDEETESVKTVFCRQLGQAELSQIMLYNVEINTEEDIARDDYKITILYDETDTKASLLHRLLEKAPHYTIAHVDASIAGLQRSFSFDDTSIYDAFQEISEEIGCLFDFPSNSDDDGNIQRTVCVYDLQQNCLNNDCCHRGEFTDECPKCGGHNILEGYGNDTLIFVTSDELASSGIQLTSDTDSVKNCFKLEAGDDLMTATIRNCNPNGTDYIWRFSEDMKADMSDELVAGLDSYDDEYQEWYNKDIDVDASLLSKYNRLVNKYKDVYNIDSSFCINCGHKGDFVDSCPECESNNISIGDRLEEMVSPIEGYPELMNAYYNTIDLSLYLESGMMPNIELDNMTAQDQIGWLNASSLSPVAVTNKEIASLATVNSAVLSMAKVLIRPTHKVQISTSELSGNIWTGNFTIISYSDETDVAIGDMVRIEVTDDIEEFSKQKIEKALNKENTDDYSVTALFKLDYEDFCKEIKRYALNPLNSFYDACQSCIDILIEQGAGENTESDLYKNLYEPYYKKSQALEAEIKIREDELYLVLGVYDADDNLVSDGMQSHLIEHRNEIQEALDFESYLGAELWNEFCTFRREDKYSNDNYISDGLNNAELFKKALEFYEIAENEIYKSSEVQYSVSAKLNNLLAIPKFKELVKSFKVGNWIRVRVDDKVYKLRLIEYGIDYGDFDNISVEFSDVAKTKNGVTDVEDILSQASSMASSYDSVQRQAKQGDSAKGEINKWLANGLNTALVQIQSNDSEEIIITKNGLLGRSYNEITDTYSPEQFKLTHNIMAYTTDNWETVSSALGKHDYRRWNKGTGEFEDATDYGLSTKFVTAGYVTGSQIIGGEVVSSNYKAGESGTYINLIDGDFDFAGKIVYDKSDNTVTLKEVTIEWSDANKAEIRDITGLEEYLDRLTELEKQIDGKTETWYQDEAPDWDTDEEKKEHLGDLWYDTDDGNTYIYQMSENDDGTYNFIWVPMEAPSELFDEIDGQATIYFALPDESTEPQPKSGDILIPSAKIEALDENENIVATYYAGKAYKYDGTSWVEIVYNGLGFEKPNTGTGGNGTTKLTEYYIVSPHIIGGDLTIGTQNVDGNGAYAKISSDGKLTCTGADVKGKIVATEGEIGGWNLEDNLLYSGEGYNYVAIDSGSTNYAFWAGSETPAYAPFKVGRDGTVYTTNGVFSDGTISGGTITGAEFYATGKVNDYWTWMESYFNDNGNYNGKYESTMPAAYYICNGTNNIVGSLSYDELVQDEIGEDGTVIQRKQRVFLKTRGDTALKLESATGASLEAETVYIGGGSSAIAMSDGGIKVYGNISFVGTVDLPENTAVTAVFA